jgi:hypothetical protein
MTKPVKASLHHNPSPAEARRMATMARKAVIQDEESEDSKDFIECAAPISEAQRRENEWATRFQRAPRKLF